ncbi:MAG: DNA starvation/stationary phase protection protein [Bacteroidetes bacterium]|nr:DNA starvation/stationary phase protection protein [Bacteroidota bacterium]
MNGAEPPTEADRRSAHGSPWRSQETVEDNPIGLDDETVKQLLPKLDEIQATMWTLYHQYQKHHWLVEGPQFRDLHHFLEENYEEVHKYIDRISERMTALGGIPTSSPANQAKLSHVEHEPEGTFRVRAMLQHDLAAEGTLAATVRDAIELALELGDHGTKRELEKVLTKAENRAHHLDHYLGEDSLEIGLTADEREVTN